MAAAQEPDGEENAQVIKITSLTGATLAFVASILSICAILLPWWTGKGSSVLIKAGMDGTETTMSAEIDLWKYDLSLLLAPEEGSLTGKDFRIVATWDEMCSTAAVGRQLSSRRRRSSSGASSSGFSGAGAATSSTAPPECMQIKVARLFTCLTPIFACFSAMTVIVARRFSPLLLLAGAGFGVLATVSSLAGCVTAFVMSATGLVGTGFILLLAAVGLSGVAVVCIFYAAAKAMPGPSGLPDEMRTTRASRVQEAHTKSKQLRAQVEEQFARSLEDEPEHHMDPEGGRKEKVPVALKRTLYWSQENPDEPDLEIPTELLQAAYLEIDDDQSGSVTIEELVEALQRCGLPASKTAAENVIHEVDKNADGTIDIHEFIEFFRTLEEMDRFSKKTEARAQFLTFICNFCFLAHIIIVGVVLMIFIKMDQAENKDNYSIMMNMLVAFSIDLGLLFIAIIAIPAARLTLGANITAWKFHYAKEIRKRKRAKEGIKSDHTDRSTRGGIRSSAWAEGAGFGPPPVNAAMYGASYRVSRMSHDQTLTDMYAPQDTRGMLMMPNPASDAGSGSRAASHLRGAAGGIGQPHRAMQQTQMPVAAKSTGIMSKTGDFVRYDPDAFKSAAKVAMRGGALMSFTPMQVQNMATSADEVDPPGMLSIGNGLR